MGFIVIYVINKDMDEALKIAEYLLKCRLIACVNYHSIMSSYWWKEKIENSDEIVSLLKTKNENFDKVKDEIKKLHSYEIPCIMKLDVESNEEYENWIKSECA